MSDYLLDIKSVMDGLCDYPLDVRLENYLRDLGVPFHEPHFVSDSVARLVAVGGIPVTCLDMDKVTEQTRTMMGIVGSQSYLGYSDNSYEKIVIEHGHASSAHAVTVSIIVAGISCAVENEFNTQRDLIHLGRITEARASVQNEPPYVVMNVDMLDDYRAMRNMAVSIRQKYGKMKRGDGMEMINLVHSKASATSVILTGDLRNFQKLLGAIDDDGKEYEYRRALTHVKETLHQFWGDLF